MIFSWRAKRDGTHGDEALMSMKQGRYSGRTYVTCTVFAKDDATAHELHQKFAALLIAEGFVPEATK